MSPRTGRPKADNPLSVDIKVRLDNDTNEKLLEYCENHNITRAEAIRKGIHLLLVQPQNKNPCAVTSWRSYSTEIFVTSEVSL